MHLHLQQPQALWSLLAAPLLVLALWRTRADAGRLGRWASLALRIVWLGLCALGLARPELTEMRTHQPRARVVLLRDCSQSMATAAGHVQQQVERIRQMLRDAPVEELSFAEHVWRPGEPPADPDQTDIEAALLAVGAESMEAVDLRAILISDGRATRGDAVESARRLALRGAVVHAVPVGVASAQPARLVHVEAPADARQGLPSAFRVTAFSPVRTQATVRLLDPSGQVADQRSLPVEGRQTMILRMTPRQDGVQKYSIELRLGDGAALAAVTDARQVPVYIDGPPRLLIADHFTDELAALRRALDPLNIPVDVLSPERWPDDLGQYAAIVLSDWSGKELQDAQRAALRQYVEESGGGLVFIGGGNVVPSRWRSNPLAELLPVALQDRPAELVRKLPQVAVCFVLDRSGSMGSALASSSGAASVSKLDLVKAATIASIQVLPENAEVAVVSFDSQPTVNVKPSPVADKEQISRQVDVIGAGGGTTMAPAVREGLRQLATMQGDRYLIVLTDGRAERPASDSTYWDALATEALQAGVSWTSIAVGPDADAQLLGHLAQQTGGQYYLCDTADQIPKVFLDRARAIKQVAEKRQAAFRPRPGPAAGAIRDLRVSGMPELHGRVRATARDAAEVLLLSETTEPLLARWQFGLGRVVAFTSDAKGGWGKSWVAWQGYAPFWLQVVQSVMRTRPTLHLKVQGRIDGAVASFLYTVTDESGRPAANLRCAGELKPMDDGPGEQPLPLKWRQLGAGAWHASADLPPGDRPYFASTSLQGSAGRPLRHCAIISGRRSAELAETGPDLTALAAIAEAGAGLCSQDVSRIAAACQPSAPRSTSHRTPLWPAPIIAALLLWLIDLLLRKIF